MRIPFVRSNPRADWAIVRAIFIGTFALGVGLAGFHQEGTAAQAQADFESDEAAEPSTPEGAGTRNYTSESLRGRVVWMADALEKGLGIEVVPEARERILALQTADGHLYPIVEDLRGRSFRKDERLRKMDLELLVRRYDRLPMIQIVRVYEHQEDGRYIVDYWCDVCAIVMYEYGPCACCQDQNRLRKRPAGDSR